MPGWIGLRLICKKLDTPTSAQLRKASLLHSLRHIAILIFSSISYALPVYFSCFAVFLNIFSWYLCIDSGVENRSNWAYERTANANSRLSKPFFVKTVTNESIWVNKVGRNSPWLWSVVLQIDGLAWYGCLNRKNQRESEHWNLILKCYSFFVVCQKIWACPADPIYHERLNPAEKIRHFNNLQSFKYHHQLIVCSIKPTQTLPKLT